MTDERQGLPRAAHGQVCGNFEQLITYMGPGSYCTINGSVVGSDGTLAAAVLNKGPPRRARKGLMCSLFSLPPSLSLPEMET